MLHFDPDTDSDLKLYCYVHSRKGSWDYGIFSGKSFAIKSLYAILWHPVPWQAVKKFLLEFAAFILREKNKFPWRWNNQIPSKRRTDLPQHVASSQTSKYDFERLRFHQYTRMSVSFRVLFSCNSD